MRRRPGESDFPWWLVVALGIGAVLGWRILTSGLYREISAIVVKGAGITVFVTVVAFALATALGLLVALAALSRFPPLRQAARFHVEVIRGVPMLVLLFYVAFVAAPGLVWLANLLLAWPREAGWVAELRVRDISLLWRAIIALTIGYSAFIAEVFRAGILAVDPGQIEAAEALGLSPFQRFRLIVLPQAIRVILPPLGNDFVAMVKDSSLVSVLGVADITQMGKVYAASTFMYFETYNIVAFLYLSMTIVLSLLVRWLERKMPQNSR